MSMSCGVKKEFGSYLRGSRLSIHLLPYTHKIMIRSNKKISRPDSRMARALRDRCANMDSACAEASEENVVTSARNILISLRGISNEITEHGSQAEHSQESPVTCEHSRTSVRSTRCSCPPSRGKQRNRR